MAGEPVKRELQHDFSRMRGPSPLTLDIIEAFEKAADVDQQTCEFRTYDIKRPDAHVAVR
jgi:hypothetical protein